MLDSRCPRCNSRAVYKMLNGIISGEKNVYVRGLGFSSPKTDRMTYLCTSCGYYENYLTDKSILQKVTQKWEKG